MARRCNFIVVPTTLWECPDLTLIEKAVLIELDSMADEKGKYSKPLSRLGSCLGIPKDEAKSAVASLAKKGAVEIDMNDNGDTVCTVFANKRRYKENLAELDNAQSEEECQQIDYAWVLKSWKESNPGLRQCRVFTPKMMRQLRTTLRNNRISVEDMVKSFKAVACSDFCQGRNDRGWQASLEWLISDRNGAYQKLVGGAYHRSGNERIALSELYEEESHENRQDNQYR